MDSPSEVRLVTCLFVDVIGSTDATVRLGPERMKRLLDVAFSEMSTVIASHGGTVEKYVGDAIFAVFGAPSTHADDAERALRAADACAQWSNRSAAEGDGLAVRIGLETGEALVDLGAVENRQRMVVGECVNVAARLQQHAEPGEVVVGPTCRAALGGRAQFVSLGTLELKGLAPVDAWGFTGFSGEPADSDVPFVGRETEVAALGEAFNGVARGTGVLAVIVGPPGQGKSRLARESLTRAGLHEVIEVRCRPGTEVGFNTPLRQLVDGDVPGATAGAVLARLEELMGADDAVETAVAVNHSAGLAVSERLMAVNRYEQREIIAEAWRRYLEALSRQEPVVLLVEDLHWADPVLLRVIDHVTSEAAGPVIAVCTARPEFSGTAGLRPGPGRTEIELGPLEPDAVQQLASLAGDVADDRAAAAVERSGGNPLFVIELSRSTSVAPDLPVTIQAAIAARIDELPPSDRSLLQAASVAGETFNVAAAALLGERPPMEVAAALGQMVHLGFVTHTETGYRFHHALVYDVAYGRLPVHQRMMLHQRYADEGLGRDDLEALAHHWWEAVRPPDGAWVWADSGRLETFRRRAFRVQLDAGVRLEQRNAYEEALEVYLRALELAEAASERAEAEAAIGRGYARQGLGDDAWRHRLAAIELYRQTDDGPPAQVFADMLEIATFNWGYFHELPTDETVLALLDEGIAIAGARRDDVALARLLAERAAYTNDVSGTDAINRFAASKDGVAFGDAAQRLGTVYMWAGRIADAVSTYETVLDRLVPAGSAINVPEALVWYTNAAFMAGDLTKADALARRLDDEAMHRSVHTRGHAFAATALVQLGRGDWDGLRTTADELRSLVDANPDAPMCILGAAAVGYGAAGTILNGGTLPSDIDRLAERMVDDSERVRAAATMLPKAMAGDADAIERGLTGYEPGLRLWDKFRVWDVSDIVPGIVLTMFERWDGVPATLDRMDRFAGAGARLAGATAAAIREEVAAASGGARASHDGLRDLGYEGISALLRYRPRATGSRTLA